MAVIRSTFEACIDGGKDLRAILSRWNGEEVLDQIHTFMVDKDYGRDSKFSAYNYTANAVKAFDTRNHEELFQGKIDNTFICAYFVEK